MCKFFAIVLCNAVAYLFIILTDIILLLRIAINNASSVGTPTLTSVSIMLMYSFNDEYTIKETYLILGA